MAVRAFVGSCATLASSVTNLSLLLGLDGEPAWICFLSCNAEILFSALTLHWVTSRDRQNQTTNQSYSRSGGRAPGGAVAGGSGGQASSSSQSRRAKGGKVPIVGTETLISDHYQAAGRDGAGGVWPEDDDESDGRGSRGAGDDDDVEARAGAARGGGWPEDTRAVIRASCGRGPPPGEQHLHHLQGIPLDGIVVTREAEVVMTREEGRGRGLRRDEGESDGRSETTAGTREREGSTEGIVRQPLQAVLPARMV